MRWIIILSTLFTLAACGYKGDLYLPKDRDKQNATITTPYQAPTHTTIILS